MFDTRAALEEIDRTCGDSDGALLPVAWLVTRLLRVDAHELNAALRRALLVQAAGGDLRREIALDDRAVRMVAGELREAGAEPQLREALAGLARESTGLPRAAAAVGHLEADDALARTYVAAALLADELTGDT